MTGTASITKILLVDDEEVSRYLVRQLLPRGTYHLTKVSQKVQKRCQRSRTSNG